MEVKKKTYVLLALLVIVTLLTFVKMHDFQADNQGLISNNIFLEKRIECISVDTLKTEKKFEDLFHLNKFDLNYSLSIVNLSFMNLKASSGEVFLVFEGKDEKDKSVFYKNKSIVLNKQGLNHYTFRISNDELNRLNTLKLYLWNKERAELVLGKAEVNLYSDRTEKKIQSINQKELMAGGAISMEDKLYHTMWLANIDEKTQQLAAVKIGLKGVANNGSELLLALELLDANGERKFYQTKVIGKKALEEIDFQGLTGECKLGDRIMVYLWNRRRVSGYKLEGMAIDLYS